MIYASILKDLLKRESSPIKKMYLNELILNWKKVQVFLEEEYEESSYVNFIKTLNDYLSLLNNPKYSSRKDSKSGFDLSHEIFSPTYLEDLIELILKPTGLLSNPCLKLEYQSFNYNMQFKSMSFIDSVLKHQLEFSTSEPVFCLSMQMNLQYRPVTKKMFVKDNFVFPLMIFYISKHLTSKNLKQIKEFECFAKMSNPKAKVFAICETIDNKAINNIDFCKNRLFILKSCTDTDGFKEINPEVSLALQKKILDTIKEKQIKNIDFVKQGCINPVKFAETEIEKEQ